MNTDIHCIIVIVICRFKTFGRFQMAMAILIPLQGLEMAGPFRNGQMIPFGHFDTSSV